MECYLEKEEYKGWDPHDGLNSPLLNFFSMTKRIPSMMILQLIKRSPINLRPILKISKSYNPKGIALFLEAFILKHKIYLDKESIKKAKLLADWLIKNYSKGYSGVCWGYPFDWANRKFYAPKFTPNIVTTVFCSSALFNFYNLTKDDVYLNAAKSSCDFIIQDLFKTEKKGSLCFSYTPLDKTCVHNANLLGSSLLARVGNIANNNEYKEYALKSMNFSIKSKNPDGSWFYGESHNQKWIDSFHSGYNLIALSSFIKETGNLELKKTLEESFIFYIKNFILSDGTVKYYHNKIYPLDAHAFSHAIICLCELSYLGDNRVLIELIIKKLISLFWDKKGYFYYKKDKFFTTRIPYMRWVQAFVFLSFFTYLYKYKVA